MTVDGHHRRAAYSPAPRERTTADGRTVVRYVVRWRDPHGQARAGDTGPMAEPLETTPNPVHRPDVSALISLLASLEGHLHDPDFADRPGQDLARPLLRAGLLEQGHSAQTL